MHYCIYITGCVRERMERGREGRREDICMGERTGQFRVRDRFLQRHRESISTLVIYCWATKYLKT